MILSCPNCHKKMAQKNYEGVLIDVCQSCASVWLDYGEIKLIVEQIDETFSDEEIREGVESLGQDHRPHQQKFACPKCRVPMNKIEYLLDSGVIIDRCRKCKGLYLDPGELEKVQILTERKLIKKGIHPTQFGKKVPQKKSCPRDGSELKEVPYESQRVDVCSDCGGIWCEDGELYQIVRDRQKTFSEKDHQDLQPFAKRKNIPEIDLVDWLNCPVCQTAMNRQNYSGSSGIIIDRCVAGHGVWMDHEELERIQIFVERWERDHDQIQKKFGGLLAEGAKVTSVMMDNAVAEGKRKARRARILSRVLRKFSD